MLAAIAEWMHAHRGKSGTLAGWYQQGCGLIGALVAVPLIVRLLPANESGVWFAFLSILAVLQLTDFGFSLVLSRQVAFSLGTRDPETAREADFIVLPPGAQGAADAYAICRRIFRWLSIIGAVLLAAIYHLALPMGQTASAVGGTATWTWYMMGATALLQVQAKPHQALLDGMGRVYLTRLIQGTAQLLAGVSVIVVLLAGGGLLHMAVAVLLCWTANYAALKRFVALQGRLPMPSRVRAADVSRRFVRIALPLGVLSGSAFIVLSIQVPLVAFLLGPAAVPAYYLAQRIGSVLNQACLQPLFPQLPLFTHELAAGRFDGACRRFRHSLACVSLLTVGANTAFLLWSPLLVDRWIGPGRYLAAPALYVLAADMCLRTLTGIWGQFVLASGRNPFVLSTFIAGCLTLATACLLGPPLGLLGIALAALVAGLCTNYWFCPLQGIKLWRSLVVRARETESPAGGRAA